MGQQNVPPCAMLHRRSKVHLRQIYIGCGLCQTRPPVLGLSTISRYDKRNRSTKVQLSLPFARMKFLCTRRYGFVGQGQSVVNAVAVAAGLGMLVSILQPSIPGWRIAR